MSYNNNNIESQKFGDLLREAREESGFDVETLARRLHIRGDIVRAIEASNLSEMPASGYARNMIRSYARTVGLNQNEICNIYLKEAEKYERGKSREKRDQISQANSKITGKRQTRRVSSSREASNNTRQRFAASENSESIQNRNSGHDDRTASGRTSASTTSRTRKSAQTTRRSSRNAHEEKKSFSDNIPRAQKTTKSMSSSFSLGGLPKPSVPNVNASNLMVAIIAIILVVLIIVVCVMLFGGSSSKSKSDDLPTMPISGLTDTSNKESDTTSASVAKTKATFTFSVADGEESYCEVYLDGETKFADVASGPVEKSFDVTGTLEFVSANPTPVTIKLDGKEVEMTADTSTGLSTYSYEFVSEEDKAAESSESSDSTSKSTSSSSSSTGTSSTNSSTSSSGSSTSTSQSTSSSGTTTQQ